jgi:Na+-driven multidrug efflux pump
VGVMLTFVLMLVNATVISTGTNWIAHAYTSVEEVIAIAKNLLLIGALVTVSVSIFDVLINF